MAPTIIARDEAKRRGLQKFYLGLTCMHGHDAERYVSGGNCVACAKVKSVEARIREGLLHKKPEADESARKRLPTDGAAFPADMSRLMARR